MANVPYTIIEMEEIAGAITHKIKNPADNEDARQEVLMGMAIAQKKADSAKGGLKAYMFSWGRGFFQKWCKKHFTYKNLFHTSLDDVDGLHEVLASKEVLPERPLFDGSSAAILRGAVDELSSRQRRVIRARFFQDNPSTLQELANKMKITKARVQQIEAEGLEKLRAKKRLTVLG